MYAATALIVAVTLLGSGCGNASGADSPQDPDVRIVHVEGNPPFSIETGAIEPDDDGLWAHHQIRITSESDTALAIATDDITIDLTGQVAMEGKLVPDEITILRPRETKSIRVLLPIEEEEPPAGVHQAEMLVPFWRDLDALQPELPDGVASVGLEYRVP